MLASLKIFLLCRATSRWAPTAERQRKNSTHGVAIGAFGARSHATGAMFDLPKASVFLLLSRLEVMRDQQTRVRNEYRSISTASRRLPRGSKRSGAISRGRSANP